MKSNDIKLAIATKLFSIASIIIYVLSLADLVAYDWFNAVGLACVIINIILALLLGDRVSRYRINKVDKQ